MDVVLGIIPFRNKISLLSSSKKVSFTQSIAQYSLPVFQGLPNKINFIQDTWDLVWEHLSFAEVVFLEQTIQASYGTDYFIFSHCKEPLKEKHFRFSDQYKRSQQGQGFYSLSTSMYQVFDYALLWTDLTLPTTNILPFQDRISISSSKTVGLMKTKLSFGDGYTQEIVKGLNSIKTSYEIEIGPLSFLNELITLENCLQYSSYNIPIFYDNEATLGGTGFRPTYFSVDEYIVKFLGTDGNDISCSISTTLKQALNINALRNII
jgi:phage-related protein